MVLVTSEQGGGRIAAAVGESRAARKGCEGRWFQRGLSGHLEQVVGEPSVPRWLLKTHNKSPASRSGRKENVTEDA